MSINKVDTTELSPQEIIFAKSYARTGNASASFAKAFPDKAKKMGPKQTSDAGQRLLKKTMIKNYIQLRERPTLEVAEDIVREEMELPNSPNKFTAAKLVITTAGKDDFRSATERWASVMSGLGVTVFKVVPKDVLDSQGK